MGEIQVAVTFDCRIRRPGLSVDMAVPRDIPLEEIPGESAEARHERARQAAQKLETVVAGQTGTERCKVSTTPPSSPPEIHPEPAEPSPTVQLRVKPVYEAGKKPIRKAQVWVVFTTTGEKRPLPRSKNDYSADLPPGEYTLIVDAPDCPNAEDTFTIEPGYGSKSIIIPIPKGPKSDQPVRYGGGRNELTAYIHFDVDEATLTPSGREALDKLAGQFKGDPTITGLQVEGHTDSTGSEEHNQALSEARALTVVGYLTSKGMSRDLFRHKGYGSKKPAASNNTAEGRARNRRIVFRLTREIPDKTQPH